jgi:integrase/recombinase XerD
MVFFHVEEQSGSKGDETAVFEGVSRVHLVETHRFRVLERGVGRLCGGGLSGGEHVERYLRHKYRTNLSAGTISSTVSVLHGFLSFLRGTGRGHLEQISRRDLEAFIEHEQDRGLRALTVNGKLKVVKAFVRFLMGQEVIGPEVLLKRLTVRVPEGLPRAMESEDVRRLLGVIGDVRDRAMVMVLLRAGMRIGELLNTKVGDVLLEERKILIYEAQKNRVGRVVYLSDDALVALKAWMNSRDPHGQFLFCARGTKPMSYGTARGMFYRYLVKAGLSHKGYSLHCLRHTMATQLLNAGMRLECLQVLLGHRSVEVTRRYAKLTDRTREEEYFRAMEIVEKEQDHVRHQLNFELQALLEAEKLLGTHGEKLPQHP